MKPQTLCLSSLGAAVLALLTVAILQAADDATQLTDLPRLKAWHDSGSYISVGGHNIFVQETMSTDASNKPIILFLHGFPTASYDFTPIWDALRANFRLLAFDFLGFGFSDKPNQAYSLIEQADIAEAVLCHFGVNHYFLLSHDYGDSVAQELIYRQRFDSPRSTCATATIDKVTMLNGGILPGYHHPTFTQRLLANPWVGPWAQYAMVKPLFNRAFSKVFGPNTKPSVQDLEEFWYLCRSNGGRHVFHSLLGYMHERTVNKQRWTAAVSPSNAVPEAKPLQSLLLINGPADPVSGAHVVQAYRALLLHTKEAKAGAVEPQESSRAFAFPSTSLPITIQRLEEHIGHYPQWEAPTEVLQLVKSHFLLLAPE